MRANKTSRAQRLAGDYYLLLPRTSCMCGGLSTIGIQKIAHRERSYSLLNQTWSKQDRKNAGHEPDQTGPDQTREDQTRQSNRIKTKTRRGETRIDEKRQDIFITRQDKNIHKTRIDKSISKKRQLNTTRHNRTQHTTDKTKQDKTRRQKATQDNTR